MNKIDRYIIKSFIQTLFFSLFALCIIFIIVTLMENLDEFLDENVELDIIIEYYAVYLPEIIKILTPIAVLLSTLFSIGRMSNLNEITAMKTGGLSLYRLMLPLLIISTLLSFGQLYFNGWVVPKSIERKNAIESEYLKKKRISSNIYNLYFRDEPTKNILMRFYNAKKESGNNINIEEYSSIDNPRLIHKIEALKIYWKDDEQKWLLFNGNEKFFKNDSIYLTTFDSMYVDLNLKHEHIIKLKKELNEMTLDEVKEYIAVLKSGGKDVQRHLTDYYGEYAFPFANLIVILFGVPFASVKKKGGMAVQIAAAMVVSFSYLIFTKISKAIGYSTDYDPIYIAWVANTIFLFIGIIIILRTRT